jgi:hypothetical protein
VIERFGSEKDTKALWQLMALHDVPFATLPRGFTWSRLLLPSIATDGSLFFRTFSQLGSIPFGVKSPKPFAVEDDGRRIGLTEEMNAWRDQNNFEVVAPVLRSVVLSMATLALADSKPVLQFNSPEQPDELGFTSIVFDFLSRNYMTVPFGRGLEGVLAAVTSERLLNKRHPIAAYLLSRQESAVDDPEFSFLHCLAGALLEPDALESLAVGDFSNKRFNWHFSSLGFHFRNVNIMALKPEHRPPYRCWLPERGMFDITDEVLAKLAEIQTIDVYRRREPRFI